MGEEATFAGSGSSDRRTADRAFYWPDRTRNEPDVLGTVGRPGGPVDP